MRRGRATRAGAPRSARAAVASKAREVAAAAAIRGTLYFIVLWCWGWI